MTKTKEYPFSYWVGRLNKCTERLERFAGPTIERRTRPDGTTVEEKIDPRAAIFDEARNIMIYLDRSQRDTHVADRMDYYAATIQYANAMIRHVREEDQMSVAELATSAAHGIRVTTEFLRDRGLVT